jgi:hypothetical protein
MNFFVNVLWIALGLAFLSLSRSDLRTGPRAVGLIVGVIGAGALAAGVLL